MKSKKVQANAAEYFRDPVQFARKVLRHDTWPLHEKILRAIRDFQRVAIKGCHASSKTFAIAEIVLWWLVRWDNALVVTTGPSWTQVKEIVWGEIHKAAAQSIFPFPPANQTEVRLANGSYAIGLSTNEAVRFRGFHGEHVLIVVDEAPGLRAEMWEAIEGARAGGDVHVVALGNPTIPGGVFYEAFTAQRTSWKTFTIDAFATPNLQGFTLEQLRALPPDLADGAEIFRYQPRPYLITRRWVYERYWEWGERSPQWEARVCGEFPIQAADALISLAWLLAAQQREVVECTDKVYAGIDVAEAGEDETVLAIRQGVNLLLLKSWRGIDARGVVLAELAPYRARLDYVNVDSIGVGAYFATHLKDQGYSVSSINVGKKPRDSEKYANLKAELYWGLRMRFADGEVAGLNDERAISQLATIRYSYNPRGQLQIESKEDARQRGVKSPDRAEAIMLAYAGWHGSGMYEAIRRQSEQKKAAEAAQTGGRPSGWSGVTAHRGQPSQREGVSLLEVYNVNSCRLTIQTGPGGGEGAPTPSDDDPGPRIARQVANLIEGFRRGHHVADLDPDRYKSYLRPVLRTLSDPDVVRLMSELDRRFGLA